VGINYRGEHFHPPLARNFDVKDPLEMLLSDQQIEGRLD
jgi:hypothetical protein